MMCLLPIILPIPMSKGILNILTKYKLYNKDSKKIASNEWSSENDIFIRTQIQKISIKRWKVFLLCWSIKIKFKFKGRKNEILIQIITTKIIVENKKITKIIKRTIEIKIIAN